MDLARFLPTGSTAAARTAPLPETPERAVHARQDSTAGQCAMSSPPRRAVRYEGLLASLNSARGLNRLCLSYPGIVVHPIRVHVLRARGGEATIQESTSPQPEDVMRAILGDTTTELSRANVFAVVYEKGFAARH